MGSRGRNHALIPDGKGGFYDPVDMTNLSKRQVQVEAYYKQFTDYYKLYTTISTNSTSPQWNFWGSNWTGEERHPIDTPQGFLDAIDEEIDAREHAGFRPSGILIHGLTWHALVLWDDQQPAHELTKLPSFQGRYVGSYQGIPIATTFEGMPEWEWVFSDAGIRFVEKAKVFFNHFDSKSDSIKAKKR